MQTASFAIEQTYWEKGIQQIAGVDEVGIGAFAGPVAAAAVILPQTFPRDIGVTDSKLLTPQKRESLAKIITSLAVSYAVTTIPVSFINRYGIAKATQKAFRKAIYLLEPAPMRILIDAFYIQQIDTSYQTPIIKGDRISISIAAASILAKVYRDALMSRMGDVGRRYNFAQNKGYGTLEHRTMIRKLGLSRKHRMSFSLTKYLPVCA